MAFSDVLQTLGRVIGLYPSEESDRNSHDYSGYEPSYGPEDGYQEPQEEPINYEEPVYESGFGDSGTYGRAGARLRQPSRRTSRFDRFRSAAQQQQQEPIYNERRQEPVRPARGGNVINMPEREPVYESPLPKTKASQTGTIIFCVRRKDDSSQIINYLIDGLNVILNFEEVDDAQCQRVLDMVSGAAFALRGSVERISHRNYLVAPTGVEIVRPEAAARASREYREASAGYGAW